MKIFLTGATGVMGMCGLKELIAERGGRGDDIHVLARPGKANRKKLAPYISKGLNVIWGDLCNPEDVRRGVDASDIVLHVGGMVSPAADWLPDLTLRVNTEAMANIIEAARKKEARRGNVKIVYIGSVSQYGNRAYPRQWGRTGDPVVTAAFDKYAYSKCVAERMLAESGLSHWASLRQTGIMHPGILMKASDPIAFHVPMATGLEWATDEASGRLLAAVCRENVDESFWNNFYNIGGGTSYRLSNYEFMKRTLAALGCPAPEKVFDLNWFATRNFHGMYYEDSDVLEELFHFRGDATFSEYMATLKRRLPFYFRLAPLAPAFIMKKVMKRVALTKGLGPLRWIREGNAPRIDAAFGGIGEYQKIGSWSDLKLPDLDSRGERLDHGYDEDRPLEALAVCDMKKAAAFRGGKCLAEGKESSPVDPRLPVEWECAEGHRFAMSPLTVLKGGHWCPQCLLEVNEDPGALARQAKSNPFLSQIC